jgi:hypothetical protein
LFSAIIVRSHSDEVLPDLDSALDSPEVSLAVGMLEDYLLSPCPSVQVHLLLSPLPAFTHGGANEGPGHVTLCEADGTGSALEVLLHETMHLMERERFLPMFMELSDRYGLAPVGGTKGWTAHHLVREALTGAVLPGGCLSPILRHKTRDFQRAAERRLKAGDTRGYGLAKLTGSYIPLVEPYVRSHRPVDSELLERSYAVLAEQRLALDI